MARFETPRCHCRKYVTSKVLCLFSLIRRWPVSHFFSVFFQKYETFINGFRRALYKNTVIMKKAILFSAMVGFCCIAWAGAPPTPAPENTAVPTKQWLFKPLSSSDVSLEVERIDANVMVYLFS